jgi:IMP dehydrogenase
MDCSLAGIPMIADGGTKNSGDIAKALAAGASLIMVGALLAATTESPGEIISTEKGPMKKYRGSASQESYEVQGKVAEHRAPEGESMWLPYKGPVAPILESMAAGLKSSMAYVGAYDLTSFKENAKLVKVSMSTLAESGAHGKK